MFCLFHVTSHSNSNGVPRELSDSCISGVDVDCNWVLLYSMNSSGNVQKNGDRHCYSRSISESEDENCSNTRIQDASLLHSHFVEPLSEATPRTNLWNQCPQLRLCDIKQFRICDLLLSKIRKIHIPIITAQST